jgi:hypothetical protein
MAENAFERIKAGLEDALAIAKGEREPAAIHVFPSVGNMVDVGGCVGKITCIDSAIVTVEGIYHYVEPHEEEPWIIKYKLNDFNELNELGQWDMENIEGVWGY